MLLVDSLSPFCGPILNVKILNFQTKTRFNLGEKNTHKVTIPNNTETDLLQSA